MRLTRMLVVAAAAGCLLCASVAAREADGTLGLIRTPNNGIPVVITTGDSFTATLAAEAALSLVNDGQVWPLMAEWTELPGGLKQAQCSSNEELPPGTYTLNAATADRQDSNGRSVYIMESIPDTYIMAHITDTHVGTTRHPREDIAIIGEIIAAVNASEASIALITGDLTDSGTVEQFQRFLEVLDMCSVPTYVVPGNHDRQARNYEQFFGPMTYMFRFGEDGFLAFDSKDFLIADELGAQDGLLYYYRRQIRPARWSIGFTHRYDLMMGMRAQLTLFVDDPLDYLFYGHYHRETEEGDGIPWGHTRFIMTPAAINGQLRFVTVDAQGIQVQETVRAASTLPDREQPAD